MEIELLTIGKTTTDYIIKGIDVYLSRLRHYIPFTLTSINDIKGNRKMSEAQQKEAEGKEILARLTPSDMVVLLDERGKEYTSMQFADYLQRQMLSGRKKMVFVVGGPYGFSDGVYQRADAKVSFSKLTFSHEMIRLFFVEQLYRAMTILRGEPYHHE